MVAATTPITLEERLRVAGASLSRQLLEELRARGGEGVALLEAALQGNGKKPYYAGLLRLGIAWIQDRFVQVQEASQPEWADEVMRLLRRDPERLFPPRRVVAFDVLDELLHASVFTPDRHLRFVAAYERLIEREGGESSDEPFVRETPKVGRNDPCPCSSGKKYKNCCAGKEAPERARRSIGELLSNARYLGAFYALDFEEQMAQLEPEAFLAHLEVLASPTRVRSYPRGDTYLTLAALSREADPERAGPRWTREAALDLIEGPGHEAADRGGIGGWLLATREDEALELAPRIVAALSRGDPLSVPSVFSAASLIVGIDAELALELLNAPTVPKDPRISILRAIAARDLDEEVVVLEELESARDVIANDPSLRDLYVAVEEVIASLDDPPLDQLAAELAPPLPGIDTQESSRQESASARPAADVSYVARDLSDRIDERLRASLERAHDLQAAAARAREEDAAARADMAALEKALSESKIRVAKARRALAQAEELAHATEKGAPRSALEIASQALGDAKRDLLGRLAAPGPASGVLPVPVLLAHAAPTSLIVLPLPVEAVRGEGDLARVEIALASVAGVAEALVDPTAPSVQAVPCEALDGLALLVEKKLGDAELLGAALAGTWAALDRIGGAALLPQVSPLEGAVAEELLARAVALELPQSLPPRPAAPAGNLPLVVAAEVLGRSPFHVAFELGARGLWTGSNVTAEALGRLRAEANAKPVAQAAEAPSPADESGRMRQADDLESDPHPGRRTLRVILRRLVRFGKIGASHTRIDNTLRGAAPHLRGLMKEVMLTLLSLGVLRRKPTLNGLHVSIEPERVPEVERLITTGEIAWQRVREVLGVA